MMKNKFKIIPIIMVIILAFLVPFVRAENKVAVNGEESIIPISEEGASNENEEATAEGDTTNENTEANTEEGVANESEQATDEDASFKKGDVYLTGDKVTIDYVIDGNLFVIANEVTINSQIGGDAFVCANSITVGEQSYIFSNLFAVSSKLNVKGVVYDLYAVSKDVDISGYIYRDIKVSSNTLNIFGTVGRSAYVNCSTLSLGDAQDMKEGEPITATTQGTITGDLNYTSQAEATLPEGAVSGKVNFTPSASQFNVNNLFLSLGCSVASVLIIWLLCLWLAPKFLKNTSSLLETKKVLPVIGLGIATPIVLSIAMVVLFLIGITSSIALLAFTLLFALMLISTSIFVITANNLVCKKLKIEKTIGNFGMLVICAIVLWALTLIPYAGAVISLIAGVLGLGIVVYSLVFRGEKKVKAEKTA